MRSLRYRAEDLTLAICLSELVLQAQLDWVFHPFDISYAFVIFSNFSHALGIIINNLFVVEKTLMHCEDVENVCSMLPQGPQSVMNYSRFTSMVIYSQALSLRVVLMLLIPIRSSHDNYL